MALIVLAACSKEKPGAGESERQEPTEIVTLTASLPDEEATKTAYEYDSASKKLKVTWAEGDQIALYATNGSGTEADVILALSQGAGTKTATFTVTRGEIESNLNYTAVYPYNAGKDAAAWNSFIATAQTQDMTEGRQTDHIGNNAVMSADLAAGETTMDFGYRFAVFKVSYDFANQKNGNLFIYDGNAPTSVSVAGAWGDRAYTVLLTNVPKIGQGRRKITAFIVTPLAEEASIGLSAGFNFHTDSLAAFKFAKKSRSIEAKLYNADFSTGATQIAGVSVSEDSAHCWVQLWTDGPKWASTNVGATSPSDTGYYFRWGEQMGWRVKDNSTALSSTNCIQYDKTGIQTGSVWKDTTFTDKSWPLYGKDIADFGGTINNTYGNITYGDAATYNWGAGWRMPNSSEAGKLESSCDWRREGEIAVFTGRISHSVCSIRIRSNGYCESTSRNEADKCYYWTSSPYYDEEKKNIYAKYLWITNGTRTVYYDGLKYAGHGIRPVMK